MHSGGDTTTAARFSAHYGSVAGALRAWSALQVRGALAGSVDPEDLVQETCLAAFRAYERYDAEQGDFRAWFFGVAHNVLRGALRTAARARMRGAVGAVPLASAAGSIPEEATTISRRVARDESLRRFVDEVSALDEEDRQLLLWRGLEGLGHAEVGELLGLGAEGARKRWQRLRARLAQGPAAAVLVAER